MIRNWSCDSCGAFGSQDSAGNNYVFQCRSCGKPIVLVLPTSTCTCLIYAGVYADLFRKGWYYTAWGASLDPAGRFVVSARNSTKNLFQQRIEEGGI